MVVDSGFQCNGTEFYLNDCSRDPNPRPADCTHARDAGVICQPAISKLLHGCYYFLYRITNIAHASIKATLRQGMRRNY